MISGGRTRKATSQLDLCVFRLEHASDATSFQRVLTHTLKLDRLTSADVKKNLLHISQRRF